MSRIPAAPPISARGPLQEIDIMEDVAIETANRRGGKEDHPVARAKSGGEQNGNCRPVLARKGQLPRRTGYMARGRRGKSIGQHAAEGTFVYRRDRSDPPFA